MKGFMIKLILFKSFHSINKPLTHKDLKNKLIQKMLSNFFFLYCQAWVQVQGLSQISNKRPGPGACSYNCNVTHHISACAHKTFHISACAI